jgi:hypothetical protein
LAGYEKTVARRGSGFATTLERPSACDGRP